MRGDRRPPEGRRAWTPLHVSLLQSMSCWGEHERSAVQPLTCEDRLEDGRDRNDGKIRSPEPFAVYLHGRFLLEREVDATRAGEMHVRSMRVAPALGKQECEGSLGKRERRIDPADIEQTVVDARFGAYAKPSPVGTAVLNGQQIDRKLARRTSVER